MKKIILLLCLCSCSKTIWTTEQDMKVVSITKHDTYCVYELSLDQTLFGIFYQDTCGKFNIGDTLNIVKK